MRTHTKTRVLSAILAVMMVVGTTPLMAIADSDAVESDVVGSDVNAADGNAADIADTADAAEAAAEAEAEPAEPPELEDVDYFAADVTAAAEYSDRLSLQQIDDQLARIIVAGANPASVDWGSEPVVLTLRPMLDGRYLADYSNVQFYVAVANEKLLASNLSGVNGNILTLVPYGTVGSTKVDVTVVIDGMKADMSFRVNVNRYEDTGAYEWGDMAIEGAGAVGGYIFHPYAEGILYAQTDVGGVWRFKFEYDSAGKPVGGNWEDITHWGNSTMNPGQTRFVGVDPTPGREDWVYIAQGNNATLLRSKNRGDTFEFVRNPADTGNVTIGINGGGNSGNLRSVGGDNFVVIPKKAATPGAGTCPENPDYDLPTMYAVSTNGIRVSTDDGATWAAPAGEGQPATNQEYLSVVYDKLNTNLIVQSVHSSSSGGNPQNTSNDNVGAFYSKDGGLSWTKLPGGPATRDVEGVATSSPNDFGYYTGKAAFSNPLAANPALGVAAGDRYIFVTFKSKSRYNDGEQGDGAIFRWLIDSDGNLKNNEEGVNTNGVNITPQNWFGATINSTGHSTTVTKQNRQMGVGISAIDVCRTTNAIMISTVNGDDSIFRSLDFGQTWFPIQGGFEMFGDLAYGNVSGLASGAVNGNLNDTFYDNKWFIEGPNGEPAGSHNMATEVSWGPWTWAHWNFSHKINPFFPNNVFIHSGIGTYVTYNLDAMDKFANLALPNVRIAKGLTIEQARISLFVTNGTSGDTMTWALEGPDRRVTSEYNDFRMYNVAYSPKGNRTRNDMVKWETAPGLFMTVQRSTMYSPATGDNILYTNTCDYPGFAFKHVDDIPWSGFSWGQWIKPEWNYLYDGTGDDGTGGGLFTGHPFNWKTYTDTVNEKFLPDKPANAVENGGDVNYTIFAATNRGIFGSNTGFSNANPDVLATTMRLDWGSNTRGGGYISLDGGRVWHALPSGTLRGLPVTGAREPWWWNHPATHLFGVRGLLGTRAMNGINFVQQPGRAGTDVGYINLSAGGSTVFWGIPGTNDAQTAVQLNQYQDWYYVRIADLFGDKSDTSTTPWNKVIIYDDHDGTAQIPNNTPIRIDPDPVDDNYMYAFSTTAVNGYNMWASSDGGATFRPVNTSELDSFAYANIMVPTSTEYDGPARVVRGEVGEFGSFLIDGNGTLYRLKYDAADNSAAFTRIGANTGNNGIVEDTFRITSGRGRAGFGLGPNQTSEFKDTGYLESINGAIYAHGTKAAVNGDATTGQGVYRSLDGGATWTKVSPSALNSAGNVSPNGVPGNEFVNANYPIMDVRSLTGDPRVFGRYYVNTGNVAGGVRYGDIVVTTLKTYSEVIDMDGLGVAIKDAEAMRDALIAARKTAKANAMQDAIDDAIALIRNESATQPMIDAMIEMLETHYEDTVVVGIVAQDLADIDDSMDLRAEITLENEPFGTNLIVVKAKYDPSELTYVGAELLIPGWVFLVPPSIDTATGDIEATLFVGSAGTVYTTVAPVPVLAFNFTLSPSLVNYDKVVVSLVEATVSEMQDVDGMFIAVNALREPASATTTVIDYHRFDINGDGVIDLDDIATMLYYYYLCEKSDCAYWDVNLEVPTSVGGIAVFPPAKVFDCNGDGIIDMEDLLVALTYI